MLYLFLHTALVRLQDLLHHSATVNDAQSFSVSLIRMKPQKYRQTLKNVKFSGFNFVIVDCKRDSIPHMLENVSFTKIR